MELKKNPNVDPKRNSKLFFQIGLVAVLFLTYLGIEYKSMDPIPEGEEQGLITENNQIDDEEVIITLPPVQKLPPPPPPAPDIIEVVEDEEVIEEEEQIQETETNEQVEVKPVTATEIGGDPNADDEPILDELPFTLIEQVPLFPGCENVAKAQQSKCFQEKLDAFVKKNFRMPDDLEPGYKARVFVTFIIDPQGNIIEVTPTGGTSSLQKAASKAFSKTPKLQPGKQRNKPVRCKFTYPITIRISN